MNSAAAALFETFESTEKCDDRTTQERSRLVRGTYTALLRDHDCIYTVAARSLPHQYFHCINLTP